MTSKFIIVYVSNQKICVILVFSHRYAKDETQLMYKPSLLNKKIFLTYLVVFLGSSQRLVAYLRMSDVSLNTHPNRVVEKQIITTAEIINNELVVTPEDEHNFITVYKRQ